MSEVIIHEESRGSTRFMVYLKPGNSVEVHTHKANQLTGVKVFRLGDYAEYDSFNLSYTGPIVGITAKTVIVRKGNWTNAKTKRMKPSEFAWRNFDFDLDTVNRENWETSMHI
jgi:hypothetical protein